MIIFNRILFYLYLKIIMETNKIKKSNDLG